MKKLILVTLFAALCNLLHAQPWMPSHGTTPVKFSDVVKNYERSSAVEEKEEAGTPPGKVVKEDGNYLFDRWNWYWSQHLDKDGYIVPPIRTTREWLAYTETHAPRVAARTTSMPSNWVFQGPRTCTGGYSGLGRINVVAFDPVDPNTLYVGSAGGGTWKTTDGGSTWASLYDNLPTLGVADIKVNPLNRNTIYVATGDGDNGDAYSSGVILSHDGGSTWLTTGLTWLPTDYNNVRSLIINPLDTNTILLGTNNGIYKTHNAGISWTNVAPGNFKQILYKPGDTNIVYGSMYTDTCSQIMRSVNGGNTWSAVTSFTDAQRINIAVCPADPTIVKAIVSNKSSGLEGIYGSINSGASYTALFTDDTTCDNNVLGYDLGLPTTSCGGQGWYDLCIAINPSDPTQVIVGGVNTYYSMDGGLSWQIVNTWWGGLAGVETVHADKHCLAYNSLSGLLYECCDGGIYKNSDPLAGAWTDLTNGICVTEFYRNAVDNGVTYCIGGAQDNGTKKVSGGVATDLTGGDGMQPLINYGDPVNIFYTSSQNGSVDMTRDGGATYHSITDTLHSSGAWITPYALHPTDTETLVLAYKQVYVTHNNGDWWTPLSPVFDTSNDINVLRIAVTNPNYLYTVTSDYTVWKSVIHYTTNFGVSWDTISIPFTNFISDLVIDPKNEKKFWVTVSGYSSTDKVYQYDLVTNSWTSEGGSLPNLPVNCIVIDSSSRTKYIGTDAAIFYRDTTMADWVLFNNHLPCVHVDDLNINYRRGEVWAATFGRGMWKSVKADNIPPLATLALSETGISVAPNPSNGVFSVSTSAIQLLDQEVSVKLITADGRMAWQKNGFFDNSGNMKINTTGLPAGFYICIVANENVTSRTRLVIY